MRSKKQKTAPMNTIEANTKLDNSDIMIRDFLKNDETLKSFIAASKSDGVTTCEIKKQLKYFGISIKQYCP